MTDNLVEMLRMNVAEVPDTYWPGRMKEYAAAAADEIESLRMVRDDHALEIERLRGMREASRLSCAKQLREAADEVKKLREQIEPLEKVLEAAKVVVRDLDLMQLSASCPDLRKAIAEVDDGRLG